MVSVSKAYTKKFGYEFCNLCLTIKFLPHNTDSWLLDHLDGRMNTDYIDPHITHMDQKVRHRLEC